VLYTYDKHGRTLTTEARGYDLATDGYAVKHERRTWPNDGGIQYSTVTEFKDAADKPCRHRLGYFSIDSEYDHWNRAVRMAYNGYDAGAKGYASEHMALRWGEALKPDQITWTYADASGDPVPHPKGYRQQEESYDARGRLTRITRTGFSGAAGYVKRVDIRHYKDDRATKEESRTLEYYDAAERRVEISE
jgi:hypothetical protein